MKRSLPWIIMVASLIAIAVVISMNSEVIRTWWNDLTTDKVVEPTVQEISITTFDVVAQRRVEIELMKIDSVYYTIPEPALIAILDFIGTETSRESIVKEYQLGTEYYRGLIKGANESSHFKPDSLPRSSVPIKPTPVVQDTLRIQH